MFEVSSPANIALIKYMGKKNHELNIPSNPSLSWTTEHLRTTVQAEVSEKDHWQALEGEYSVSLNEKSIQRFLSFWKYLKDEFVIKENYLLKSNNNFPFGCGLASSASSFSALVRLAKEISGDEKKSLQQLALLSAKGSGSSCRSLLSGWVEWNDQGIKNVTKIPYTNILHKVIVLERAEKKVSSSSAHKIITTSLLNEGRGVRALFRLKQLKQAFISKDWQQAYHICWAEFKDMHALFETSTPAFSYMSAATQDVLNKLQEFWSEHKDGPIITMDAGPNVHLLFREDQKDILQHLQYDILKGFQFL